MEIPILVSSRTSADHTRRAEFAIKFEAAVYEDGKKVKNARITVRHNGKVVHDDLELPKGTPGRYPEGPGPESLYLQDHGNPVVFRNIWVVKQ